jgi:hypothetical protein
MVQPHVGEYGVTPCSLVDRYPSLEETYNLNYRDEGGGTFVSKLTVTYQTVLRHTETFTIFPSSSTIEQLTAWNRFLLVKLTVPQLVKKVHAMYGTRIIITLFTSACHLSLS